MTKEIIKYLLGRFIPPAVNLVVILLAVRFIGPAEYGRFSLLLFSSLIAITLSFHWVQVSIMKFLGGMSRESNLVMSRFFDLTIISAFSSTLIVLLLGWFFFHVGGTILILILLFTFLNTFYLFHQAILQAYHCSVRSAILEGTFQVLVLIALLIGLFVFKWNTSVLLIGALVFGMVWVLLLRVIIRVKGLLKVDLSHIYWDTRFSGKVVEFGYGLALWLAFSHLLMAADRFIIMEFLGYKDAGLLSIIKDLLFKVVTFASFPIYMSYQAKVTENWNTHHEADAWKTIKEAVSFELLIFIIVFIIFMVVKPMIFENVMKVKQLDNWLLYLPVLISAFLWQVALLLQRFLDLTIKPGWTLIALVVTVIINVVLNLIFVPVHGLVASTMVLLGTTLLYTGFVIVMSLLSSRRLDAD